MSEPAKAPPAKPRSGKPGPATESAGGEAQDGAPTYAAAIGLAFCAVGFIGRRVATGYTGELKNATDRLAKERTTEGRAAATEARNAVVEKEALADGIGTGLLPIGVALVVAALLGLAGVRLRRAMILVAPALLFAAIYGVMGRSVLGGAPGIGVESVIGSSILTFVYLAYVLSEPSPRGRRAIEDAQLLPMRLPREAEPTPDATYRQMSAAEPPPKAYAADVLRARASTPKRRLRAVTGIPGSLGRALALVGSGKPQKIYQLKESLAYLVFVEADALSVEDYTSVVMLLDEPGPRFVARPLPMIEGKLAPNTGVPFKKDPEFMMAYLVEAPGQNPKDIRSYLSAPVRDELLDFPSVWLQVDGSVATVTIFGEHDVQLTDRLVELADVVFAEYGAGGGETLLEPDGVETDGAPPKVAPKKKKKSSSKGAASAASPP